MANIGDTSTEELRKLLQDLEGRGGPAGNIREDIESELRGRLGGGGPGPAGAGSPQIQDFPELDATIFSGLPLFNQGLRNLFSNIFTSTLAGAAQNVSGRNPTANRLFENFLPDTLNDIGIGSEGGFLSGIMPDTGSGSMGTPSFQQLAPSEDLFATLTRGERGGVGERAPGASPFLPMLAMGLGAASSAANLGGTVAGALADDPEPPRQTAGGQAPFTPMISDPQSLQAFVQLLQLFGPQGGVGPSPHLAGEYGGASRHLGDTDQLFGGDIPLLPGAGTTMTTEPSPTGGFSGGFTAAPTGTTITETASPTGGVGGGGGVREANVPGATVVDPMSQIEGLADIFPQISGAFSLPTFQGETFAGPTPLQRQSTDFAAEFLGTNPFADTANIQGTLNEMISSGGRFDLTPQFDALADVTDRRLDDRLAQLNEQFGVQGLRFGSDVARAGGEATAELLAQESLNRANIAQSAFENASNRRLQAVQLPEQLRSQALQSANIPFQMGEANRAARERAIQRQMAEFARTQGALFPQLLQFALAGTEGDSIVLGPQG